MPSDRYAKGKMAELELAYRLWRAGWLVVRAPASGRRARRLFYPDILAARRTGSGTRLLIFEVKLRDRRRSVYLEPRKYRLILELTRRSGAEAWLAVKVASEGRWYLFRVENMKKCIMNGAETPCIDVSDYDRAATLEEVIGS